MRSQAGGRRYRDHWLQAGGQRYWRDAGATGLITEFGRGAGEGAQCAPSACYEIPNLQVQAWRLIFVAGLGGSRLLLVVEKIRGWLNQSPGKLGQAKSLIMYIQKFF